MYELIVAEKPDAAKRIAEALSDGKPVKKAVKTVPYYELKRGSKNIVVGCAVGHLFGLAEKKKSKGFAYPVFDIDWVPTYAISKSSAFSKKYFDALKKLAKDASAVSVATDYDVEGEVIGLNIVRFICDRNDAHRLKFSTLTKDDLVEAYDSASAHLDWGQAEAGETRHFLDFYYGINLSRALTRAIKSAGMFQILSTGRVQGPALKIVVDRERDIAAFKPVPYWKIELQAKKDSSFVAWHEADKFWEKDKALAVMDNVKGQKKGKVASVKVGRFKQNPPVPFDLTSLQTEAYRCFGINPSVTLAIAQDLYTSGWISYPRTSSQQLPVGIGYQKILKSLGKQSNYKEIVDLLLKKDKLVPNNGKKTDPAHPAIYPTGIAPGDLDGRKAKVYDLVVKRFLAVFGEPAVRETVIASIDVNKEIFIVKGTRTVEKNWHVLYAPYVKLEEAELPKLAEKDDISVKKIVMHDEETQPPKRYTPASLIRELEKRNLGTKATRAEIVETLRKRNYVTGESLTVTQLGMGTVDVLEKYSPGILDEDLTRHFELDMEAIREGKKHRDEILSEAKDVLTKLLAEFKSKEEKIGEELKKTLSETKTIMSTVGACPVCKKGTLMLRFGKYGRFIACDKYPDCKTTFKLPSSGMVEVTKNICPKCQFPMVKIIRKGKRPQEVCINLDCPGKEVPDYKETPCPKCKEGKMVLRKSIYGGFLACNRFPKCRNIARLQTKSS
ncbi:DNA topoisomerase I [Candidatus Woesearchaeota archaeon]|nr:DNA topoisomerase I [Candidatus Woesearchaeota archaeon]MBW3016492.1 DNA topoisomerase I [Candidatus Woesearchaeota archaeon]